MYYTIKISSSISQSWNETHRSTQRNNFLSIYLDGTIYQKKYGAQKVCHKQF